MTVAKPRALLPVLAAMACCASCLSDDDIDRLGKASLLGFDPPTDCDGALFDREFASCPLHTMDAAWPNIWEAMKPPLTRRVAYASVQARVPELAACCAEPALVEIDVVVGCDGAVIDTRVRAPWLAGACIDDAVRAWTFARPSGTQAAFHVLVPCGGGA